jgi:integrase
MARKIHRLNDRKIKQLVTAAKPFEMADGSGLWLRLREGATAATFRFRYRYGGNPQVMVLGKYGDGGLSLKDARDQADSLNTDLTKNIDIAEAAKEREREAIAKSQGADNAYTVAKLADDFLKQYGTKTKKIRGEDGKLVSVKVPRWKHPEIVVARFEKDIRPHLGHIPVDDVKVHHVQAMLNAIVDRDAPTTANDVLRWTRKLFDYAINQERTSLARNPAARLTDEEAGGEELARDRALSRDELVKFFEAMRKTQGFSMQNVHTFKLLLLLAVRKSELVEAPVSEFGDLKAAMWELPAERTKTEVDIDIPLSKSAVTALKELMRLGDGSDYLLPARKMQKLMLPHIHENTLNVALSKVRKHMAGVPHFHVHDLRRTARTHLAALGVDRFIAERCLNHKIKGVEGDYDRHDYFEQRRDALERWAELIEACEAGHDAMTKWWAAFEKREAAKRQAKS